VCVCVSARARALRQAMLEVAMCDPIFCLSVHDKRWSTSCAGEGTAAHMVSEVRL